MSEQLVKHSTSQFLMFTSDESAGIEVRYEEGTIWLTQKLMAQLFDVDVRTVNEHLGNIFHSGELNQNSVIRKFRITASDGKNYLTNHYNLDAIISVGYRVNSIRATQFRQWATNDPPRSNKTRPHHPKRRVEEARREIPKTGVKIAGQEDSISHPANKSVVLMPLESENLDSADEFAPDTSRAA